MNIFLKATSLRRVLNNTIPMIHPKEYISFKYPKNCTGKWST